MNTIQIKNDIKAALFFGALILAILVLNWDEAGQIAHTASMMWGG